MEIWKDIIGFEDYKVSNFGNVFSKRFGRNLKPRKDTGGYHIIGLHKDKKKHEQLVHRLVAKEFIENLYNCIGVSFAGENRPLVNVHIYTRLLHYCIDFDLQNGVNPPGKSWFETGFVICPFGLAHWEILIENRKRGKKCTE